jgi:hypothetical protein
MTVLMGDCLRKVGSMDDERRRRDLRKQLNADLVATIDVIGQSLPEDAAPEDTLRALRTAGLGDIECVAALMILRGLPLREAKTVVTGPWPPT